MATEATGHQENEDHDGRSIGNEQGTVTSRELSSMRNSRSRYISWLTRVYNKAARLLLSPICTEDEVGKRDLIFTAFSRFEEAHLFLLTLLEQDYEGRKGLEGSFAYQLEIRSTFLAKVDNWIVNQSVDSKNSASQAGLSVSTTTSRSSTYSSKLKLCEARERRELARLRMQQLQLSRELEQKRVNLTKQEEPLKLRHEYELASVSERIWMEPEAALELKPVGRIKRLFSRAIPKCPKTKVSKDRFVSMCLTKEIRA